MLTAKVALVTDASAGVGRAIAVTFARAGWGVGLLARGREGLDGAVREIQDFGGHALAIVADVADAAALDRPPRKSSTRSGRSTCGSTTLW